MIAVLAALLLQQPPADPVVTIRKKNAAWTFAKTAENRAKLRLENGREKELDVPARLYVAWTGQDLPRAANNPFAAQAESSTLIVSFYRPGKDYGDESADHEAMTHDALIEVEEALATSFVEFDLDFPGGSWEDLAKVLQEKLSAAWPEQLPDMLKPHLPAKLDIAVSTPPGYVVRYPAVQAKSVSLARLRFFGLAPEIQVRTESVSRFTKGGDLSPIIEVIERKTPGRLRLSDANRSVGAPEALQITFFNLASKTSKLPRAEDVVALFELAWKAKAGPLFARVKYHPETQTILLQGTLDEIHAAQTAFNSLVGRPAPSDPTRNPLDGLQQSLDAITELLRAQAEKDKK